MDDLNVPPKDMNSNISAIIFDLDGTLLSTEQATRGILKEFLARYSMVPDEEKDNKRLGMAQMAAAIALIQDYDIPLTPEQYIQEIMPLYREKWLEAKALPGANRLMKHIQQHGVPFALASNSSRKNVDVKVSIQKGWQEQFAVILGSDQVKAGKPSPYLFLEAASRMVIPAVDCLVIEDSIVGVKAAKAAGMKVVAVPSLQTERDQYSIADCVIHSLLDFQPELWGLPPFGDWIHNTLPIDPIQIKCSFSKGILHNSADDDLSSLPDQLYGLHFGWAKVDNNEIVKVVLSIGWQDNSGSPMRKIRACFLHQHEQIHDQKIQLLVVGYHRGTLEKESLLSRLEIRDEDMLTAETVLELPDFSFDSNKARCS
ncbi:hypothetical protein Leryth_007077 [Lithospermum erythrorhizon]|nr:hypothetical protein Leryth_007077 [Lithospermum erythrorhizon]